MDCLAAGSLFRAIPDEGQECKGPGDAVAVGSRRRGHARVAPFPGEDSGTRFSDIAWSRQSLVPFCPSRAGGLGRAGGDASYLVGQCLIDVAAAKRISPAEALDPAGRRAKSSPASCQDKQKQKIISAKTLISTTPAADASSSMFTAFFRHCLPAASHRERHFSRLPLLSTLWGAPSSHARPSLLGGRRSEGSLIETHDGEGWGLRERGVI